MTSNGPADSRRRFLQSLTLGTLGTTLPLLPGSRLWADDATAVTSPHFKLAAPLEKPEQALDVFDLETLAKAKLPPAHFGYLASGVDGDLTVRRNREAFDKWRIRPRRMIDVTKIDTTVELFGTRWPSPLILAPIGGQRGFHPDGELGSARAARAARHLQIVSNVASVPIEEIAGAHDDPWWFQLYPTTRWEITEQLVRHADQAGAAAIVVTADYPAAPNRLTQLIGARNDSRDCDECHAFAPGDARAKPMYEGMDVTPQQFRASNLTWDAIARLRAITRKRIVIKGILTPEDAEQCVKYGADALVVSNHGGRTMETGMGTLECLPDIAAVVAKRIPVLVDSGFRRGTDIFKGLALGADAVCIGRPYIWGLAAFGQAGVERAMQMLRTEFENTMRITGVTSIAQITRSTLA